MRDFLQSRLITHATLIAALAFGAWAVVLEIRAADRVHEAMSIHAFITRLNSLELHILDYEETTLRTLGGASDAGSIDDAYAHLTEHIRVLRALNDADASATSAIDAIERELIESKRIIDEALSSDDPAHAAGRPLRAIATLYALREIRHAVNDQRTRLIGEVREITHTMSLIRTMTLLTVGLALFVGLQSIRLQRASHRLRESEARHRALFESSRDAILVADDAGRYVQINDAAAAMFGYARERFLTMRVSDLSVPVGEQRPADAYARYLRTGAESGEFRFLRADGAERVAEYTAMRVGDNMHMSIMRDVTERRRAETDLVEAVNRYECVVKATEDTVWDWDIVTDERRWSGMFTEAFGYADTVVRQATPWVRSRIHPDDRARVETSLHEVLDGETQNWVCEYRFQRADGAYAIVYDRGYVVRDDRGAAVRMIGAMIDFTQRRAQQEAVRVNEERYRLATLATQDAVWDWTFASDAIVWNRALEDRFGYAVSDNTTSSGWWLERVHPDDRERVERGIMDVIRGDGHHWESEYRFRRANGLYAVVFDSGYVTRDANGTAVRMIGVMNDVTHRRRAEDELRESERRFRTMADSSPLLIWVTNRDRQCEYVNRAWLEFSGRTFEEMTLRGWTNGVHPSDLHRMDEQVGAAVRNREHFTVEYRYIRADGERRWLVDTGAPRFLDNGELAGYVGSCMDITERKQAEERLKLLNRELNHRVKNNLAAIQVLAERTVDGSASLSEFRAAFAGRINALARMHDLTLRIPGEAIAIDALMRLTLEAYDHPCDHAVTLEGDPVRISKVAGTAINMIIHELATNAVKHGALSSPGGAVHVGWTRLPDSLRIVWTERGGPAAQRPEKTGFGFELIEGTTRHELNGHVAWEFTPAGLHCTIVVPIATIESTPNDDPANTSVRVKR